MKVMEFVSQSQTETKRIAGFLAQAIKEKSLKQKGALVIAFEGDLGSGKTTFIQGLARGLGARGHLTSPTFVLLKRYSLKSKRSDNYKFLYHLDCYRLPGSQALKGLDFNEVVNQPKNIILIEWAERVRSLLPQGSIWLKLKIVSDKTRRITINLI